MAKRIIRLTESELHGIVSESVERILNEGWFNRFIARKAENEIDSSDLDPSVQSARDAVKSAKWRKAPLIKGASKAQELYNRYKNRPTYDKKGNFIDYKGKNPLSWLNNAIDKGANEWGDKERADYEARNAASDSHEPEPQYWLDYANGVPRDYNPRKPKPRR